MKNESQLWTWFLFYSGLPTQRAKTLLVNWQEQGISLPEALAALPGRAGALNLTPSEAARLQSTYPQAASLVALGDLTAVRWDDPLYPRHLQAMPLKLRPALLFCRGETRLLSRPLVYLAPGDLTPKDHRLLREAVGLLMDEALLLSVYAESDQAALLLEELADAAGEALLFARSGLTNWAPTSVEASFLADQRLLVASPLPPGADSQPEWDRVLQQVAMSAVDRVILSGTPTVAAGAASYLGTKPALALQSSEAGNHPILTAPTVCITSSPADILPWFEGTLPQLPSDQKDVHTTSMAPVGEVDLGPPPSAEEILTILRRGGEVPAALRQRLKRKPPEP